MLLLLQNQIRTRLSGHVAHTCKTCDECIYLSVAEFKRRDQLGEKLQIEEQY